MHYGITCLVTSSIILPLVILIFSFVVLVYLLLVLVYLLLVLVCPLVVLVSPLAVSVYPLVILVVLFVGYFIADPKNIKSPISLILTLELKLTLWTLFMQC